MVKKLKTGAATVQSNNIHFSNQEMSTGIEKVILITMILKFHFIIRNKKDNGNFAS